MIAITLLRRFFLFLQAAVLECFAFLIVLLTGSINLAKRPSRLGGQPILLVHGYLHNSSAWIYLWKRLERAGLGPIYAINLGSPFHTIEEYAEKVRQHAEQIVKQTGRKDLILIGHSMGGLVSMYYANTLAPRDSVTSVITLGSPLNGTKVSCLGFGPCVKQMEYESEFVKAVGQMQKNSNFIHYMHLGTAQDLIIIPSESAFLHSENSVCEQLEGLGHICLLYSPTVANKIISFLKNHSR